MKAAVMITAGDATFALAEACAGGQDAAVKAMGRRLLWSVVCLVPLFSLSMGLMMGLPVPMFMHTRPLLSAFVLLVLTVPILILNRSYFTVGFSRLFKGAPNMDSLVALGAAAGLVYSSAEVTVALVSAAALSSWAP